MPSSVLDYISCDPYPEVPSSHAHRKYELVYFPSGLQCLLISDTSSHMVAASATVGCGSFNDPDEIHGMAHLCEHLVVSSGPQARLRQVISNSGGDMNAYTGSDQTSFGFEISSYIEESRKSGTFILDSLIANFASFFDEIKITIPGIKSEIRSVHEEQMLNVSNIDKILWHGLRLLADKKHPFSRFATGNKDTLSKAPGKILKAKIEAYHSKNFTPQNMALVIKGPQSINHLKKVAMSGFSKLEKREFSEIQSSEELRDLSSQDVFDQLSDNVIFIKSDSSRLRLCFPMTHEGISIPFSAQTFLCNIIGNESVESLCYHLKTSTQMAENVFVHTQNICQGHNVLVIDVETTVQGMKRVTNVIEMIFEFLESTLSSLPDSEMIAVIKEYSMIEQIQFQAKKIPSSALDEIVSYSEYLQAHKSSPELIVRGNSGSTNGPIEAKEMKNFICKYLARTRAIIQVSDSELTVTKQFSKNAVPVLKAEYFGFEYSSMNYYLEKLCSPNTPQYKISPPIGALRSKLSSIISSTPQSPVIKYRDMRATDLLPQLWHTDEHLQIWTHKTEVSDEIEVSVHIKYHELVANAENLVGIEIMASIIGEKLQFLLYNLETLGCSWGLYVNVNGEPSLMISVRGPIPLLDDALTIMFSEILTCLGSVEKYSYQEIKRARVLLRRMYEEYTGSSGVKLVFVTASMLFDEGLISPAERIKALELIDTDTVVLLGTRMLNTHSFVSVLVSGNVSESQLAEIKSQCQSIPDTIPGKRINHPESSYLLPKPSSFVFDLKGPPRDPLGVVFYYIQMGERGDLRTYTMAKLVESVISALAVDDLRIKRNLAYGVFSGMRMFKKSFGVHITVPSGQHSCAFLMYQIEAFIENLENIVASYSHDQFSKIVRELVESVDDPAGDEAVTSNLFFSLQPIKGSGDLDDNDEHKVHWNNLEQILNQTYNFGGKACEEKLDMEVLENVTLEQFNLFFRSAVNPSSSQRATAVICKEAEEMSRDNKIEIVCKVVSEKLQEANLDVSRGALLEALQRCQDLETLSDLNLDSHFTGISQSMKYKKFKAKMKVGGYLKKWGSKNGKSSSRNAADRQTFTTMTDFQQQCSLVK